jgi:uncharacterized coiled-coil DUF342 family protein
MPSEEIIKSIRELTELVHKRDEAQESFDKFISSADSYAKKAEDQMNVIKEINAKIDGHCLLISELTPTKQEAEENKKIDDSIVLGR